MRIILRPRAGPATDHGDFHDELERAGVLLERGPDGSLLIQVRSQDEALEWARRCPAPCDIDHPETKG